MDTLPSATPTAERDLMERSNSLLLRCARQFGDPAASLQPYLGQGSVLSAILIQQAAEASGDAEALRLAAAHLNHGGELLDKIPLSSSLYRGVTGFGWAVQTFARPDLLPWREEFLADLDDILAEGLEATENLNIDIINGLAGIAVYALSRGNTTPSATAMWTAVDERMAQFLATCRFEAGDAPSTPGAAENLGVAHGLPGLLSVGAVAAARGMLSASTSAAIREKLDLLWGAAFESDGEACFGTRLGQSKQARLAWCYGGLGLATTFGNAVGLDPTNAERANLLCKSALAQFRAGAHGCNDASLCHGHAGVALAFAYLARTAWVDPALTEALREAALKACLQALESELPGENGPVFLYSSANTMKPSGSFLEGGPGVALSLASVFAARPAEWMQTLAYY